uniref:Chemokine (C-C motif) ligand 34b, duplicate 4 n=1 Tax=Cyprinus carpio TaxID=7962 RepID=A0A8C1U1N3_CYPCA
FNTTDLAVAGEGATSSIPGPSETQTTETRDTQPKANRRPTRVGVSCCKEVSKARIPPAIKLIGYKHQNALSPCVDAIIFYTEKEKYCSDPKARWIKDRLKGLELIMD